MENLHFRVSGISPIMFHNVRLANPLDPLVKEIKEITGKKKKTDDDYAKLFRLEWEGGLYHDPDVGVYVPGINIDSCIKEGARLQKRGRDVERSLQTVEDKIPLVYKGPKNLDKMFEVFRDIRSVVIGGKRTMRCRPLFPLDWSLDFNVSFNPEILNPKDVVNFLMDAGRLCGLMEYRPRFGKFEVQAA